MERSSIPGALALGLLFLLLLGHSWYGPDIWYHLVWGRELIENGRFLPEPRVLFAQPIPANGYWLFQGLMYLAYQIGGLYLPSALFALLWFATAGLWLHLTGLWRKPFGIFVAFAFVICMQMRFEQRPEVFSYFFIVLMTWLAARGKIWPLVVAQILWSNIHGFFVLGPTVAALVSYSRGRNGKSSAGLWLGLMVATGVTPFGFKVWENVLLYAELGRAMRDVNHELFMPPLWPLYWPTSIFWLMWVVTFAVTARALLRRQFAIAVLALAGLALSAQAMRNIPLLFLLSPLVWSDLQWRPKWPRVRLAGEILVAVVSAVLAVNVVTGRFHRSMTSLATFGIHLEPASYPIRAVEFLRAIKFSGRVFTDSYDGGFAQFFLPDVTVAGDSYFSDPAVTREYFAAIKNPEALRLAQDRFNFSAMIINIENSEVISALMGDPAWVVGFADSHRAVFLKRAEHPELSGDLSQFTYYRNEDLRHWVYEFGIVSWLALGYLRDSPELINKILTDLQAAPAIPRTAFNIALKYATDKKNEDIIKNLAKVRTTF